MVVRQWTMMKREETLTWTIMSRWVSLGGGSLGGARQFHSPPAGASGHTRHADLPNIQNHDKSDQAAWAPHTPHIHRAAK